MNNMNKWLFPLDQELIGKENSRLELSTPTLVLDLDVLEKNIATAAQIAKHKNINLRPHFKSHKSVNIAKLQIAAGAIGISCVTLGEAETLSSSGISSILITSPIVSPSKIARLIKLNQKSENMIVVVDNLLNIETLAQANAVYEKPLQILIDFDIGQKRTGAKTIEKALALVQAIQRTPSLKLIGLQAYGGHFQHIGDYVERQRLIHAQNLTIKELVAQMEPFISTSMIITGGGTGSFDIDLKEGIYSELQIGSYIFMDVEYNEVKLTEQGVSPFFPSLFVMSSVVSTNSSFAVVDAGLKSFATDGPKPVIFSKESEKTTYQFMGDEHGKIISTEGNQKFPLNHRFELVVPHCDPTVNLYDFYHCVRGSTLVDIWPIDARGLH